MLLDVYEWDPDLRQFHCACLHLSIDQAERLITDLVHAVAGISKAP